jgi:hypothetical protein
MSGELNRELGYHMLELALQNTNFKPNFHNDAKSLNDLAREVNENLPQEKQHVITPIIEPEHFVFENKSGENLSAELETKRKHPQIGVKIGDLEITVISDLRKPIDETMFTPSRINEQPIQLMESIRKQLQTQDFDSRDFDEINF